MLIFAVDDEPKALHRLHNAIEEAAPEAEIQDFLRANQVLSALEDQNFCPDVVFSDIRLPGMDGLSLAVRIKKQSPETKIVFVTGYPEYAADAYRIHAEGYVTKPVEAERIREELNHALPGAIHDPKRLWVRCFGDFEVFWQGKPLTFQRRQTKELFAYLIDKRGAESTSEELSSLFWAQSEMGTAKHRLRTLIHDLRTTLASIGQEELLIRRRGLLAIRADMVDCDYYRMLRGDMAALNDYHGLYMRQYSWAELTAGSLHFHNG